MPERDIHVDHDEIAQKTKAMQALSDDIDALVADSGKVTESMIAEASQATRTGAPAPVFEPVIESATVAMKNVTNSLTAVRDRINSDIEILTSASGEAKSIDEESAAGIDGTPTNLGN